MDQLNRNQGLFPSNQDPKEVAVQVLVDSSGEVPKVGLALLQEEACLVEEQELLLQIQNPPEKMPQ